MLNRLSRACFQTKVELHRRLVCQGQLPPHVDGGRYNVRQLNQAIYSNLSQAKSTEIRKKSPNLNRLGQAALRQLNGRANSQQVDPDDKAALPLLPGNFAGGTGQGAVEHADAVAGAPAFDGDGREATGECLVKGIEILGQATILGQVAGAQGVGDAAGLDKGLFLMLTDHKDETGEDGHLAPAHLPVRLGPSLHERQKMRPPPPRQPAGELLLPARAHPHTGPIEGKRIGVTAEGIGCGVVLSCIFSGIHGA